MEKPEDNLFEAIKPAQKMDENELGAHVLHFTQESDAEYSDTSDSEEEQNKQKSRIKYFSTAFQNIDNSHPTIQALTRQWLVNPAQVIDPTDNPLQNYRVTAGSFRLLQGMDEKNLFAALNKAYMANIAPDTESPEEQKILIDAAAAKHVLYFTNMRLAYSIADRHRDRVGGGLRLEDHLQQADLGLITAIHGFDSSKGGAFSSYAYPTIYNAITEQLYLSSAITIPRRLKRHALEMRRLVDDFESENGTAAVADIEEITGLRHADYVELIQCIGYGLVTRLDAPPTYTFDSNSTLGETIEDIQAEFEHTSAATASDTEQMLNIIKHANLTERELFVIGLHYNASPDLINNPTIVVEGVNISYHEVATQSDASLQDIGSILKVSRERVRQIEARGMEKLRSYATTKYDGMDD